MDNRHNKDEGLIGNEKIEEAVLALQSEPSQAMLAHTLTVIRRRMKEGGQLIVAVEPSLENTQMRLQTVKTEDGGIWWSAFTSFDEELKGADSIKSAFLTDIERLFHTSLEAAEIKGIIINPWNRTIMLDRELINIILGQESLPVLRSSFRISNERQNTFRPSFAVYPYKA